MKRELVIIGAGTAGTMLANRLVRALPEEWRVTIVNPSPGHLYQPAMLFIPFGASCRGERIERPREETLLAGVKWVRQEVERVDSDNKRVELVGGESLSWELLILASGCDIDLSETEGLDGEGWLKCASTFYDLECSRALAELLERFEGGHLVVNTVELPIKCPVAPIEFALLADAFFRRRGLRDRVEITFVTPLDAAFTKPLAAERLSGLLESRGIHTVTDFSTGRVCYEQKKIISWDEREVGFDLLVVVPTHKGAEFIERSGLGDELRFVPTDDHTLLAKGHDDIFVIGDATDLPTSKAGSVSHFQAEGLVENILGLINGEEVRPRYDGHANCFIETGNGKAMLIDFNYEQQPVEGSFPLPLIGPFRLLKETRLNHLGKLAFQGLYWGRMLLGKSMPVTANLSLSGKRKEQLNPPKE